MIDHVGIFACVTSWPMAASRRACDAPEHDVELSLTISPATTRRGDRSARLRVLAHDQIDSCPAANFVAVELNL